MIAFRSRAFCLRHRTKIWCFGFALRFGLLVIALRVGVDYAPSCFVVCFELFVGWFMS